MNAPSSGASILVVDDTIQNLRLLGSLLGEQGYDVRPVTSGRQALVAAAEDPPELILLDITMPEMDGYETCERLKESEALKDIPVIFLTALGETSDKVRAFAVGGADYITKPFQIEEVLARVRVHLALRRAQVDLTSSLERLRALETMRDDLVHMVVHDMRSPLTVLLTNLQFLQEDVGDQLPESASKDLGAALQAATGLTRMTNDLLDVSRIEEGKLPLNRKANDLGAITTDVAKALAGWDRTRSIEVQAQSPVSASCDGAVIRRVVENLVSNAIKHTPSGGRIRVTATPGLGRVRVTVEDEGPGVPADAMSKIFEKFGTLSARSDRQYHSAGLGLAFCKLAVEAHGGSIGVQNAVPSGSVFWFELPA